MVFGLWRVWCITRGLVGWCMLLVYGMVYDWVDILVIDLGE
jgi:hypothetical protein